MRWQRQPRIQASRTADKRYGALQQLGKPIFYKRNNRPSRLSLLAAHPANIVRVAWPAMCVRLVPFSLGRCDWRDRDRWGTLTRQSCSRSTVPDATRRPTRANAPDVETRSQRRLDGPSWRGFGVGGTETGSTSTENVECVTDHSMPDALRSSGHTSQLAGRSSPYHDVRNLTVWSRIPQAHQDAACDVTTRDHTEHIGSSRRSRLDWSIQVADRADRKLDKGGAVRSLMKTSPLAM